MSKLKSIREIEMERAAQPNFGKGISVASGFDLGAKAPLDSRLTVKTTEERDAHVTGNRAYEGMLVYVEADKKTYQLIDNKWEEFGFNDEKFQAGIKPIVDKNEEQDSRLTALEELVVGGEGEGIESILADVAANKAAIAQEILDRDAADKVLDGKISALDSAYKNADSEIKGRLDSLESNTADLGTIRTDIEANTAAIAKETLDRTTAVSGVESKVTAEVERATQAEIALGGRIDGVVSDLASAKTELKQDSQNKADQALTNAKAYTDEKVLEINTANSALEGRVAANEAAVATVDTRIESAKTEAVDSAKGYTDGEITKIDAAYKAADTQVLTDAKEFTTQTVDEAKRVLEGSISTVDGKVTTLTDRVSTNESEISNLKDAISNKNSNTIVVNTEAEITTANSNPKVGDLAYVVNSKRAYIYKGVSVLAVAGVPEGWVVFDEITSELDLVDYLKIEDANSTFRKLSVKIVEGDLDQTLTTKINGKADKTYVDDELAKKATPADITEAINPVDEKVSKNTRDIEAEVSTRTSEITRVEGVITSKVKELSDSLTEKESALKEETDNIKTRIDKFVPVVTNMEPQGTEAGHVWLEIL